MERQHQQFNAICEMVYLFLGMDHDIGAQHIVVFLELAQEGGDMSIEDLAQRTGLSEVAIARIVHKLDDSNIESLGLLWREENIVGVTDKGTRFLKKLGALQHSDDGSDKSYIVRP